MKASLRAVKPSLESWGGRGGRLLRSIVPAALLLLGASSALASRVVDVRVAKHPKYTRVVFQLDAKTTYQIARNEPGPGIAELVVTLDAGGPAHLVRDGSGLVERITIVGLGPSGSIARIRLSQSGLLLKEMVLREPARIVLDILEQPAPPTTASAPPVPKPAPQKEVAVPVETELEVAGSDVRPGSPVEQASDVDDSDPEVPTAEASQSADTAVPGESDTVLDGAGSRPDAQAVPRDAPAASDETEAARAVTTAPIKPPVARAPFRTAPGPPLKSRTGEAPMDLGGIAVVAGGIALIAALFLWWRRRGGDEPSEVDNEAFVDGIPLEDSSFQPEGSEEVPDAEAAPEENATDDPEAGAAESSSGPIFDLSARERLEESDGGVDLAAALESGAAPQASEEAAVRLVRELERRVANLETRLDEVVDSRERVDRQVVAQTEELRVQRAAIARTQRAVRHLSRNADDTPTEPALRDPS